MHLAALSLNIAFKNGSLKTLNVYWLGVRNQEKDVQKSREKTICEEWDSLQNEMMLTSQSRKGRENVYESYFAREI